MSRGYRFAVVGVLWGFAAACHYIGVAMFRPKGALWDLAQGAVDKGWIAATWREQIYQVFAQYLPLLLIAFSVIWLFASEYEAQVNTARRPRR